MKKSKLIILIISLLLVLILFVPFSKVDYDDGGTRAYKSLTYKIVCWNRLCVKIDKNGNLTRNDNYEKVSVYWFADSWKSIGELWDIENPYQ